MFLRFNCLSLSDHNDITNSSKSRKQTKDELQSEGPSVNTLTTPQSELESFPLSWITKTRAVLDSCAYNSLLILTVEDRNKRLDQIYMFQCEEIGVSHTLPEPSRERRKCLISRPLPIFHDYVPLIAVALEFAVVFKRICLAQADPIKVDLDKAIGAGGKDLEPRREVKTETPEIKYRQSKSKHG